MFECERNQLKLKLPAIIRTEIIRRTKILSRVSNLENG